MNKKIYRLIDANLNRSREGLRVVEEVARLYLNDKNLSAQIKRIRHKISKIAIEFLEQDKLLKYRNSQKDVGAKGMRGLEKKRDDLKGIVRANLIRTQEGLRVLEELGKLVNSKAGEEFKKLRFKVYSLEKRILTLI
ncbi:MAG: thiamine-phosphate pyrophosphorylase [candidate division Zixibacteria bacterium]|nr:thiamine-phosphate pyrophosphorylase [candidate division Zixibacteria bacterium]